ncbi:MAG: hypothetical protein ACI88G_000217 [Woeseiaceae bacterium]
MLSLISFAAQFLASQARSILVYAYWFFVVVFVVFGFTARTARRLLWYRCADFIGVARQKQLSLLTASGYEDEGKYQYKQDFRVTVHDNRPSLQQCHKCYTR